MGDGLFALSDPDKIRTCNLLIRSEMRYPVAPRGLFIVMKLNLAIGLPSKHIWNLQRTANIFLFTFNHKLTAI